MIKESQIGNEALRQRFLTRAALVASAAVLTASCSSDTSKPSEETDNTPSESHSTKPPKQSKPTKSPQDDAPDDRQLLTFDHISGETIVMVYPGVTEKAADKVYNGTYPSGESVPAICVTTGRLVEFGGIASKKWIEIEGTPGEEQYATAVFTEDRSELIARLDECR